MKMLDNRVKEIIVNKESLNLYERLKNDLETTGAKPLEFATMIHEIGHLDASITVGAKLGIIMVDKHCYHYSGGEWLYSMRRGKIFTNCVFAYIDNNETENIVAESLVKMYAGGMEFTKSIKDIKPRNWYHRLRVTEQYRRNSIGISNRKSSDTKILEKLTKHPSLAKEQNEKLKSSTIHRLMLLSGVSTSLKVVG